MSAEVRRRRNEPSKVDTRPSLGDDQVGATVTTAGAEVPENTWESDERIIASNIVGANQIEINVQDDIWSVKFLPDGQHVVSAGRKGKIRRWRVADGKEMGEPMDAGSPVEDAAISRDGKWIVVGTDDGRVTIWNAISHEKETWFQAHSDQVKAVDISPDSTKIASGSNDWTVCVWLLSTGERLLGPFKYDNYVPAVKFSPDGRLIAAAYNYDFLRVYDSQDGRLAAQFPIYVNSSLNGGLAWTNDGKQLLALSRGDIHCLEVSTWTTLSKWSIREAHDASFIALTPNDKFIAASRSSSLSLWDATSHRHLATVTVPGSSFFWPMAISPYYDIVIAPDKKIILRHLLDILPSHVQNASQASIANLEDVIQRLRDQLASSDRDNRSLREQHENTKNELNKTVKIVANLENSVQGLRGQLATADEEKEHLKYTIQSVRAQEQNSTNRFSETVESLRADLDAQKTSSARKIADLEKTVGELTSQLAASQCALRVHEHKLQCESTFADDRIYDAAEHLLEILNTMSEDLQHNPLFMNWLGGFRNQCISLLWDIGGNASSAEKHVEAFSAYSTILLLTFSPPNTVLMGWARMGLRCHSVNEVLGGVDKFMIPKFYLYRAVCDVLKEDDRVTEAIECFQKMKTDLLEESYTLDDWSQWELDFKKCCIKKIEECANIAGEHDVVIGYYSSALSLDPTNINDIIFKCCKAREDLLKKELVSASKVIEHDPSDYRGYKKKYYVLHSMCRYMEAFDAFEMMLSTMEKSPDPQVCDIRSRYLDTTPLIRKVIDDTIRDIPRVLIDTATGHLHDKTEQAAAFEELQIFNELRSAMTTRNRLDYARIKQEVEKFYQYVMFSHRWQLPEPTFQMVERKSIYKLRKSPAVEKLINFCHVVQSCRFRWAWSDTCCVNQADKEVQQKAMVAMFRWYYHAALTIVHLFGVLSESQQQGNLRDSIWNTRGWTYQEYVASRTIQFYTEDWKPYLGLNVFNHKESPIILSEMEQATKFTAKKLATLQPGLDRVREKLYLASKRQTTEEEDIAYSLFGIFDVSLPVMYGEGKRAVRRLLEHILTQSEDVMLLSWTGNSNGTKSYLPADLTVYNRIKSPHVPRLIKTEEMDRMIAVLRSSFPDPSPIIRLYKRLYDIPSLSIVASRLKLYGFVFPLTNVARCSERDANLNRPVYRATSRILGELRIQTRDNLVGMHGLILVHPWISPLVDQDFSGGVPQFDLGTRAFRLVVRLGQPFGGLLLALQRRERYRRVATDSFIMAQIRAETPLKKLMDSIRKVRVQ